jgi:hypothetical protein
MNSTASPLCYPRDGTILEHHSGAMGKNPVSKICGEVIQLPPCSYLDLCFIA